MPTIRLETPEDDAGVRAVNEAAFGQSTEAELVEMLCRDCPDALSLVADDNGIVGHILFTPALVEAAGRCVIGVGLAPMAVLPGRQGLAMLRERGYPFVIVLGHPEYYPRFGFERASEHGLSSQWEGIRDEAFMVLILDAEVMDGVTGVASFRDEFDAAV